VRKDTVFDSVLDAIKRSRKGISHCAAETENRSRGSQLSNALYKLNKRVSSTPNRAVSTSKLPPASMPRAFLNENSLQPVPSEGYFFRGASAATPASQTAQGSGSSAV